MSYKSVRYLVIWPLRQRLDWIFSARTHKEDVGALRRLRPTVEKSDIVLQALADAIQLHQERADA